MGKNQSASGLTNIVQYDNNGNITFVSGSTTLMQISSSGAITTTGVISGSNALSSSYALNSGLLNGTGSVGFATTGSLLTVSSSQQQISASQQQISSSFLILTASFNAVSSSQQQISASYIALSASYNTFSGSASTRITENSSSIQQISSSQQQISASLLNVISIFATTGSNSFRATQSITGSLTVTGQIIAQTLNVQQVTSSIIYSSGSNNFGCDLNSRQTFTGSVLITGSLTIAGASSAASYSGTTIYGSTAVCSPVGKFTSCIDAGSGIFSSTITTNGEYRVDPASGDGILRIYTAGTERAAVRANATKFYIEVGTFGERLSINNSSGLLTYTGAATFSSTITGTTIYGSTAVCSPVGLFSGCVGIGTITPNTYLQIVGNISTTTGLEDAQFLTITNSNATANNYSAIMFKDSDGNNSAGFGVQQISHITNEADIVLSPRLANGDITERIRIKGNGNVGIGTASPCAKLHINGSTGASTYKGFAYTYAGSETLINEVLFQAVVGGYSSNLPIFLFKDERSDQGTTQRIFEIQGGRSGVGTILTTLASGNVGIGTCTPSNKLDVIVASSNSGVSSSGIAISDGAANRTLMFLGVNTAGYTYIQSNQDNVSSKPLVLQGSGGSVYIGGTSADYGKLDITVTPSSYTAALGLGLKTDSGEGNSVGISFKTKVSLSGVIWENARIAAFTDAVSSSAYGALAFYTMNATTLCERMRIGNNGYVGIGIASPGAKLHVDGTIFSTTRSNTIDPDDGVSNNFQGYSGYWALRTDNSNRFNLDVYNSGTPINALQLSLAGESTFSKSITATGLSLSCSTGLQKIGASRLFTANTTTYYDTTINQAGMLIINSSNDRAGVFVVSAPGAGNSAISEIGDPSSYYSTTCNNANTVNFFFSGGSGNLIMQNCSGATRDFSLTYVGTS